MSAKYPSFINCMIIENAYHGNATGRVCKPNGRVDQLEDRYLGMVEAPSSNLGTSTHLLLIDIDGLSCAAKTAHLLIASVLGSVRPPLSQAFSGLN